MMMPVEDHEPIVDKDPKDSECEGETTQTAEDIVLDSLASGALSEVCEVTAGLRELEKKKTPCSVLFPVEHYQSLRA